MRDTIFYIENPNSLKTNWNEQVVEVVLPETRFSVKATGQNSLHTP